MTPTFQLGLDFSRKFWSNGTGKLYFIPGGHVGPDGYGQEHVEENRYRRLSEVG
ncbi:hypothetical protein [Paenibacillus andongensis]|uniref:hypothetical protein n=1 Tax=Paenibacillus andongensis TaxID=2975482 RepID=UPI0021BB000B|nr:hypothetical protein [Paenibacillus andongensis]